MSYLRFYYQVQVLRVVKFQHLSYRDRARIHSKSTVKQQISASSKTIAVAHSRF